MYGLFLHVLCLALGPAALPVSYFGLRMPVTVYLHTYVASYIIIITITLTLYVLYGCTLVIIS